MTIPGFLPGPLHMIHLHNSHCQTYDSYIIFITAYLPFPTTSLPPDGTSPVTTHSPDDTYEFVYNGHGYRIIIALSSANWVIMASRCDSIRMHLVEFDTDEEFVAVRDYINSGEFLTVVFLIAIQHFHNIPRAVQNNFTNEDPQLYHMFKYLLRLMISLLFSRFGQKSNLDLKHHCNKPV